MEVLCHFKDDDVKVIRVYVGDEVHTVRRQYKKRFPDSIIFKLHAENKIIHLEFSSAFKWKLIKINEKKDNQQKAVKSRG